VNLAVLHPGEMGVSVGAALAAAGHRVFWLPEGRSHATRERAEGAGFCACGNLRELADRVAGILSVCPPAAAEALASQVRAAGFKGIYVDANAVSPATARRIGRTMGPAYVDGGIVGPPAVRPGAARLYLSGSAAEKVARWFDGSLLETRTVAGEAGAASALKMCYAAYTKGSSALLLAIRALAEAEGVDKPLLAEWEISQPGLADRSRGAAAGSAAKAWRFVGEMEEIAATFREVGLPGEFHDAAAVIYRQLAPLKGSLKVDLAEVVQQLLETRADVEED
jgi:3-hydroxyisobutyrate dehydrogenase-like beta-hydroxyacid dehydrogenase